MKYGAVTAPAGDAFAVTPSDVTRFYANALYVGGTGDVAVETEGGTSVTFFMVPAGAILPIRCRRVLAATTATNILGLKP